MAPFPSASGHANDLGRSEGREAVHESDADLDFCGLTVSVSGADALAEGENGGEKVGHGSGGMSPLRAA